MRKFRLAPYRKINISEVLIGDGRYHPGEALVSHVFKDGDRLVLDLDQADGNERKPGFDLQLLSPLLLGLLVPFMAAGWYDPESLSHLRFPIFMFLLVMFFACTALFIYTYKVPGRVASITVDRESRTVEIEWRNLLASSAQVVPFEDITALRVRNAYDDDGYAAPTPELVLRSRPAIRLPEGTSEQHLRPLRAAIGLG